ncbi:Ig-like V-type domain-containing protein FAM187A [Electrophorus electricus]|uniref:Ig-like domain-containing protein n=1 Tax=Electrophorus electricus TaxID=8005 RepID=A0AAY5EXF6_ELEEL|nr:Ig-like V-type domain-containing protein FAM187A [Electrophorus electricus]
MRVSYELLLLCAWTLCPWQPSAYQAPEDKEDIFTTRACPAFLVFESAAYVADMTIELPCRCKPEDALSVVWYYQKYLGTQNSRVLTDFAGTAVLDSSKVGKDLALRSRFTIRLFGLLIFMVQESDSGYYVCGTPSGEYFYGYEVDVQLVRHVRFNRSLVQRIGAQEASTGQTKPYRVFTSYWPWSVCDRCDVRGEQTRVGLCYVMSQYLQVRYLRQSSNVISCGSAAVPLSFGLADGSHGAEVAVQSCHAPCLLSPTTSPQQQALLDFLAYAEPNSPRQPVYYRNHPAETDLVLSCPGATAQQVVAWDKGPVPLYRSHYMEGQRKSQRVFIDSRQNLHFQPAHVQDKGTYYCWLRGRKVAEIRLAVYPHMGRLRRISDPVSLFALRTILISYACLTAVFLLTISVRFVCHISKEQSTLD